VGVKELTHQGVIPFPDMANIDCYIAEDGEAVLHETVLSMVYGDNVPQSLLDKVQTYESAGGVKVRGIDSQEFIDILFDYKQNQNLSESAESKRRFLIHFFILKGLNG
jgi:hypothetical protein